MEGFWNGLPAKKLMRQYQDDASFESGKGIARDARLLCPVGEGDPQHLRDTIRVRRGRQKEFEGMVFVFAGDRDYGVYWGHFVEYGTYDKPGTPFMRPAADKNLNATREHAKRAAHRAELALRREKVKWRSGKQ